MADEPPAQGIQPLPAVAIERFTRELDRLVPKGSRIGLAVSGGPDSLAMLLLAVGARPGNIAAASVDHGLREGSRAEAEAVALLCERLGVPHEILTAKWNEKPATAIQERARQARYGLLAAWARRIGLAAVLSGHHADDQAETVLMRLARGSGVRGLAAMRPVTNFKSLGMSIVRPLLRWRRSELADLCTAAGVEPTIDPSNSDEQFERVRMRRILDQSEWADPLAISRSAARLSRADEALRWAAMREWRDSVKAGAKEIGYRPGNAPLEIKHRIARRAVVTLAGEGVGREIGGSELDRLVSALSAGRKATLRGVLCSGGEVWNFAKAPPRGGTPVQSG